MVSLKATVIYGWIVVGVLIILLVLVWTGTVDASLRLPILVVAAALIASRMILRFVVLRGAKKRGGGNPGDPEG